MKPLILGAQGTVELAQGITPSGLRFAARTDRGINYKDHNEDRVVIAPDDNLFAIADGMGGHKYGENAAQIVAEFLAATPDNTVYALIESSKRMLQDFQGAHGGACVATCSIDNLSHTWTGFHAGDVKRLVILNREIILPSGLPNYHESKDHNLAAIALTEEDRRNPLFLATVTQCIDESTWDTEKNDGNLQTKSRLLLYSDGVSDNIPVEEMLRLSARCDMYALLEEVWEITTDKMVRFNRKNAKTEYMKRDNRAMIVVDIPE